MGGPLSVTFIDIYMVKMENDIVIPCKPIFYRKRKLGDNVLFDRLNSHHPNIKLTIEVNVSMFWTSNSPTSMVPINSTFIGKTQNYLLHGPPKLQNAMNEIQSMVIFIIQKEYHQNLTRKSL